MMNTIRQYSGSYCFQSNYGQSVGANFISEVKQLISIIFLYIFPTVTFLDSWTTLQKSNSWVKREASFLCGWESCCPPTPILWWKAVRVGRKLLPSPLFKPYCKLLSSEWLQFFFPINPSRNFYHVDFEEHNILFRLHLTPTSLQKWFPPHWIWMQSFWVILTSNRLFFSIIITCRLLYGGSNFDLQHILSVSALCWESLFLSVWMEIGGGEAEMESRHYLAPEWWWPSARLCGWCCPGQTSSEAWCYGCAGLCLPGDKQSHKQTY